MLQRPYQKTNDGRFQNQLNLLREECPNASAADIWAAFGSPQDMAKTMTYDLPVAERIKYDRLRRCRNIVIALLVALFVALTIYTYCFQEIETFYITEITVIGEEYYTDDPVPTEETVEPTEG